METKKCIFCETELKGGRSDRKYCDAQCRASYHNAQTKEKEQNVRQINDILKKNWKILKMLNPKGHSTVRKSFLDEQGYNFNYFTNVYLTVPGKVYYFCYDMGITEIDNSIVPKVNIVDWQPYMKEYKLPIGKNKQKKNEFKK